MVVNHPEMSLFRGLNEAPTTKGGPACSRTACPPVPDAHNSFIQEPHVHTKAPEINPTSRHPGQCPASSQNPRLKRGDSIQGRSNRRPATDSQHGKKHFSLSLFFFLLRGGLGEAGCRSARWLGSHSTATLVGQRRRAFGPALSSRRVASRLLRGPSARHPPASQPGPLCSSAGGFVQPWPV